MHLPATPETSFAQRLEKPLPVSIILKDRFAPVPSVHQVIDDAGIFDSQFAGHERQRKGARETSQ